MLYGSLTGIVFFAVLWESGEVAATKIRLWFMQFNEGKGGGLFLGCCVA